MFITSCVRSACPEIGLGPTKLFCGEQACLKNCFVLIVCTRYSGKKGDMATEITQRVSKTCRNWKRWIGVLCDMGMPVKVDKTVVRQALSIGAETRATTRGQDARLDVNEMRMLRWMGGVTRRDRIRNEDIRGTTRVVQLASVQENYLNTIEVPC